MTIFIANDHAGFQLKLQVIDLFSADGIELIDLGCASEDPVDYPVFAESMSQMMQNHRHALGILICGAGTGMAIAANRYPHLRAAVCLDQIYAELARSHNNANVLVLGARFIDISTASGIISTFLETPFSGGRHRLRVEKL